MPASARAGRKRFSRSELGAVVLLLAAIGVFYGFTMRPGDPWSDDFAQYVAACQKHQRTKALRADGLLVS